MQTLSGNRRRPGFTLIELLVVMGIIVLVATLAIAVAPRFSERQRTSMGASQVQGWLFVAKESALRDQAVRGVRLLVSPNTQAQSAITAGTATVAVPSLAAAYAGGASIEPGVRLYVSGTTPNGTGAQEIVTVLATNPTASPPTFTANFANSYVGPPPPNQPGALIIGPQVTELQYLQQPDPFTVGFATGGSGTSVTITLPSQTDIDPATIITRNKDFLYLRAASEIHLITDYSYNRPPGSPSTWTTSATWTLTLLSPGLASGVSGNTDYWIQRSPQPMASEPNLELPQGVAIELFGQVGSSVLTCSQLPGGNDILFTPGGPLLQSSGAGAGKVILWVRDSSQDDPTQAEPTLVTVYGRTGAIAAHPVNLQPNGSGVIDYYQFTKDGRSSGM